MLLSDGVVQVDSRRAIFRLSLDLLDIQVLRNRSYLTPESCLACNSLTLEQSPDIDTTETVLAKTHLRPVDSLMQLMTDHETEHWYL